MNALLIARLHIRNCNTIGGGVNVGGVLPKVQKLVMVSGSELA